MGMAPKENVEPSRNQGFTGGRSDTPLHVVEAADDDGGENEEEEVVDVEDCLAPLDEGAGYELGEDVLGDRDKPDEPVSVRPQKK